MAYRPTYPLPEELPTPDGCRGTWAHQLYHGRKDETRIPCTVYRLHTAEIWAERDSGTLVKIRSVPGRRLAKETRQRFEGLIRDSETRIGKDSAVEAAVQVARDMGLDVQIEEMVLVNAQKRTGIAHRYWSAAQYVADLLWHPDGPLEDERAIMQKSDQGALEWWMRRSHVRGHEATIKRLQRSEVLRQAMRALVLHGAARNLRAPPPWAWWTRKRWGHLIEQSYPDGQGYSKSVQPRSATGAKGSSASVILRGALHADESGWTLLEAPIMVPRLDKPTPAPPWQTEPLDLHVRQRILAAGDIKAPRPYLCAEMHRWALYGLHRWPGVPKKKQAASDQGAA